MGSRVFRIHDKHENSGNRNDNSSKNTDNNITYKASESGIWGFCGSMFYGLGFRFGKVNGLLVQEFPLLSAKAGLRM